MNDWGRYARNPLSLLVLLGLAEVAGAQLAFGPEGSVVVLSLPDSAQRSFAALLLLGALLSLAGAAMPEPRAYWLDAGGNAGCLIALTAYTVALPSAVTSWTTALGFVFGAIAVGCLLRLVWLTILIVANFYPHTYARLLCLLKAVRRLVRFRR